MDTDLIVDSSIIVALVTLEEYSEWTSKKVKEHECLHVLDLSFYEVANAIKHKVSENLNAADASTVFKQAEKMMNLCSIHNFSEVVVDALNKALELEISVYDAGFLSLAIKLDARLLTLDQRLAGKLEQTSYGRLIECPNREAAKNPAK